MKTLFIGQNSTHLNSVDSTNSYATEMLRQIAPIDGTLIYTFNQQKGRGQRENTWESEAHKNIALTVVLAPNFINVNQQFYLTQITSLALADLMAEILKKQEIQADVKIKWPNDLYINGKKIAGVLIENVLRNNTIQSSIIGVGININQSQFESTTKATSLKILTNSEFDLLSLIEKFCENIEAYYLQLKANKGNGINQKYLSNLYQMNDWKNYFFDDKMQKGKIIGTDDTGKLILQLENSTNRSFDLKEIIFE